MREERVEEKRDERRETTTETRKKKIEQVHYWATVPKKPLYGTPNVMICYSGASP